MNTRFSIKDHLLDVVSLYLSELFMFYSNADVDANNCVVVCMCVSSQKTIIIVSVVLAVLAIIALIVGLSVGLR